MVLETYKTEQDRLEKEEAKKAGVPEEPEDTLTVKEIINSKEQSSLLGDMIEHDGDDTDKELMSRLVSGKMEATDIDRLEKFRGKFSEKMRNAETIREEITPELAQEIAKQSPEIQKIVKLVGPEGVVKAVQENIMKIAVTDPEKFKKISKSIENIKSFREGDLKKLDDSVKEKCKKEGINADEYMKALAIPDDGERMKALEGVIKNQWDKNGWGGLKRAVNWLSGDSFSGSKANRLESGKGEIDAAFAELAKHKKKVGSVLGASIKGNKDLLEALSREIVGEPKKKEAAPGMNDVKKVATDAEGIKKNWDIIKKKEKPTWNSMTPADQDTFRNHFMKEQESFTKKRLAEQGGFWAMIFGVLFDTMFAGFDKKSLN
jgi:hypothetical protein